MASFAVSSCDDLVQVEPQNSVSTGVALSDVNSYQAVLTSVYDRLQSFNYWGRDFALLGDALSDNIFTASTLAGGRYVTANVNGRGAHYGIWGTAYAAINELNTVISTIDGLTVPTSQVGARDQVKAEAYALRAMIYFDLARVYGYEPTNIPTTGQGAGFNKSVILRITPTTDASQADFRARATIDQVYAQIESDFKASFPLFESAFAATKTAPSKYKMNIGAAHALLGKVYLYAGKYAEAVTEFDAAMATSVASLANSYTDILAPGSVESYFELRFVAATEMAGVTGGNESLFSYTNNTLNNPLGLSTFGGQTASAELQALFTPEDTRWGVEDGRSYTAAGFTWGYKYTSSNGTFTDNPKIIRYADVLLMKAEALAMQGQYAPAATLVDQLRAKRITGTPTASPTDATIINFIKDERRRELYFEGHRWFDLKRYGEGIAKPSLTGVGTIPATDFRILAQIPTGEVQLSPAVGDDPSVKLLEQNPGY